MQVRTTVRILTVLVCCTVAGAWLPASHAGFDKNLTVRGDMLVVRNLIGEIEIEANSGPDFRLEVRVQGADASPERVGIDVVEGGRSEVNIRFPLDESKRYVYPRIGGSTSFTVDNDRSWLAQLLGGGRIKVSSRGSGLELWADVTVHVPAGATLVIEHGVGTVSAHGVEGELDLSTRSGPVEVGDVSGPVSIDTGSGHVTVADIDGDVHVDTGSGHVTVSDVRGEDVAIDTGSGRVNLERIDGSTVLVDTGSGHVEATGVGADEVTIDTGSGSVTLELDRMGTGTFEIDTGSGGIDLRMPPGASAHVSADTGSGGIRLDLTDSMRMHHQDEDGDEAEFTIGGGDARVVLDTGSGGIRISQ